jgi:biotin operon repressor
MNHPSLTAGTSQCSAILELLTASNGRWVPMIDLHRVSGSMAVHSRISDLRERGHDIQQRSERVGKSVRSYYSLTPATGQLPLL